MNDTQKKKYFYFLSGKRNELHLLVVHLRLSNGNRVRKTWVRRSEHKRVACSQFSSNVMWVRRDARTLLYQWANILRWIVEVQQHAACVWNERRVRPKNSATSISFAQNEWNSISFRTYACLTRWVLFISTLSGFFLQTFQSFYLSFDINSKQFSLYMHLPESTEIRLTLYFGFLLLFHFQQNKMLMPIRMW